MRKSCSRVCIEKVQDISSYENVKGVLFSILDKMKDNIVLSKKAKVMIKINLCLLKGHETGATIDPKVARALVEWLLQNYDIEKVYLAESDATHLGADMAFKILGWDDMFRGMADVELFNLSNDETVHVNSKYISDLKMSKKMMNADLLISLAKLKTHTQQKITCIMKNQFGAIPYKYKIVYHPKLTEAICGAVAARIPDLCIVDGLIAMEGNGPTNGVPRRTKLLLTSNDAVSMDHYCARIMGFNPLSVPNLRLAIKHSLGNEKYEVIGSPPVPLNLNFKFLPKWKEIIKKGIGLMQRGTINEEA